MPNLKITFKVALAVILLAVFVYAYQNIEIAQYGSIPSNIKVKDHPKEQSKAHSLNIGNNWQWVNRDVKERRNLSLSIDGVQLPFSEESVYEALRDVKLHNDGNVVIDHNALMALEEALDSDYQYLNADSLEILKELILKGLPGKAGLQTTELVESYYKYLGAKEEFNQLTSSSMIDGNYTLQNIENNQELYDELKTIRQAYLGSETAEQLFRVSDASIEYMFESMKLSFNNELSLEEKQKRSTELYMKKIEQSVDIDNWTKRYQYFISQKELVLSANISDDEKKSQIKSLLEQQFTKSEIDKISFLELEEINLNKH